MMGWILTGMLGVSILAAWYTGRLDLLAGAATDGAQSALTLALSIGGAICLWSGVGEAMRRSGMARGISCVCAPLLLRLFPKSFRDREAADAISANFSANLLGLGNAATPLGIKAVQRMQALSGGKEASDESCRFIVLNTASLQLLPTTLAALRASLGAERPLDLLPAIWLSSACSVCVGLAAAYCFAKCRR